MYKQLVYQHCLQKVQGKINLLEGILADLRQSSANETKSSAGDKYETARAMLQIEQDNTNRQLAEALAQRAALQHMDITTVTNKITNGSLVTTDKGLLFIGTALGKIIVADKTVMALSAQSPLGSRLMGLGVGQTVNINSTTYLIEEIA